MSYIDVLQASQTFLQNILATYEATGDFPSPDTIRQLANILTILNGGGGGGGGGGLTQVQAQAAFEAAIASSLAMGAGNANSTTQRVTLAADGAGVTTLTTIRDRIPPTWTPGGGLKSGLVDALPAGENYLGRVGGNTVLLSTGMTRPADTNPYAANDAVSVNTADPYVFSFVAPRTNTGTGYITSVKLSKSTKNITNASFRAWFFSEAPTSALLAADNAEFNLRWASDSLLLGYADLDLETAGASSDCATSLSTGVNIPFRSTTIPGVIYGFLTLRAAYTPAASEQFRLSIGVEQN